MALYTIPNITGGYDTLITGINSEVSVFIPMVLLFVFGVVFLGGILAQKRRTGFADIPMWSTLASISTLLITLAMTLTQGLILIELLSIVVAVTILSGFWLFMSSGRNEI